MPRGTCDDPLYDAYRILIFLADNGIHYDVENVYEVMAIQPQIEEGTILCIRGLGTLEIVDIIPTDWYNTGTGVMVYEEEWICELVE